MKKWKPDEAEQWLVDLLRKGPLPCEEVRKRAKKAGLTKGDLTEARYTLGVKCRSAVSIWDRRVGQWEWYLPGR